MKKKKTFQLATLGCRTNQYETQAYRDQLIEMGFVEVEKDAELCIINTCTVTESADSSSRHEVRQLIRQNPDANVVVTGCLAERRPDLIQEISGVTKVVSNLDKENLVQDLFPQDLVPEFSIKAFEAHTRAFVKVQDGCNSYCTYCIIPYVRGRSRSRSKSSILKEVQDLVDSGYKEIVITGINVGDYDGGDAQLTLAELIHAIDQMNGLERIRLSSIDPDEVGDALIDVILNGKHTCHSMHIVLQSGSNVILKRMNRKYTRQIFLNTIERLKNRNPDFTFTTDVIVGFPGETDRDFEETLEIMGRVQFAAVHLFPFSRRKRTRADLYPNQIPSEIVRQRKQKALESLEKNAFELRNGFVGRTMKILTEHCEGEATFGHTANFLKVIISGKKIPANQMVDVMLTGNTPKSLIGELL